ncbi:3-oxoacyl-ACP reductase family protein [Geoalkalibacter halelectricus]|uniref:3-oxoacyl-ACP reductase family protein n=1 Tax=Geoalkalibacter halelectricus TaxID=2847045 RepID=UPI003D1B66DF
MKRVIFVTGASRGIGRGIAELFLDRGHFVSVGYRDHREDAENLAKKYPNALPVQLDVSDRFSIKKAIEVSQSHFGRSIEVLVNNGAIAQEKPFLTITDEDWDRMHAVNLRGPFAFTQETLPDMIEAGWGRIVNITSIGGQWGGFNQVHYASAKAGLINFTRSMAKIFSANGITINAVAPGLVATAMSANELQTEAGQEKVKAIPARRLGTISEVAETVLFLSSEGASYITGQTINVNGGMYFG